MKEAYPNPLVSKYHPSENFYQTSIQTFHPAPFDNIFKPQHFLPPSICPSLWLDKSLSNFFYFHCWSFPWHFLSPSLSPHPSLPPSPSHTILKPTAIHDQWANSFPGFSKMTETWFWHTLLSKHLLLNGLEDLNKNPHPPFSGIIL